MRKDMGSSLYKTVTGIKRSQFSCHVYRQFHMN